MKNFWKNQKKGFLALAPMAGITDSAFRQICADYGVDVFYSEMASAAALNYSPEKTLELLRFSKKERPYVAQLFGNNPEHFAVAVKIVEKEIKPDGIDINFGCPVPKVVKQGAGSMLFKDLKLSHKVIKTVIENTVLPVSIKTRVKVGNINILKFLDFMKDLDIKAIMIHGRTKKQGFKGPIDTQIIKKVRKYFKGIIIANGGIKSYANAKIILKETGADGIGIGQGAMGKPWIFESLRAQKDAIDTEAKEILKVALKHTRLAKKLKGDKGIIKMRKHLCWYAQEVKDASKLRNEFARIEKIKDIENIIKNYKL